MRNSLAFLPNNFKSASTASAGCSLGSNEVAYVKKFALYAANQFIPTNCGVFISSCQRNLTMKHRPILGVPTATWRG